MKYLRVTYIILAAIMVVGAGCERPAASPAPVAPGKELIPVENLIQAETYTAEEVSQHSTSEDCWVIIEDVIYNITDFASSHPAGAEEITRWCGQDATEGFNTKNQTGGKHSNASKLRLDPYFAGHLSK